MNNNIQQQRNGFTLVEVAIVIVFMGIFVTFASSMLKSIALSSKNREARERLATASDAVQAATIRDSNRELPSTFKSFTSAVVNSRDYWNQQYRFYPYTTAGMVVRNVCRKKNTNLSVCLSTTGNCTNKPLIKDIAYVVISTGNNRTLDTVKETFTAAPCSVAAPCFRIPINEMSTTADDLYKYVTLLELKKAVGCVEADSGLRILNGDLPKVTTASLASGYDISVLADGGQPLNNTYTWSSVITPALPAPVGLTFNNAYKNYSAGATRFRILGTPTAISATTNYILTLKVTDSTGVSASKSFDLTVTP